MTDNEIADVLKGIDVPGLRKFRIARIIEAIVRKDAERKGRNDTVNGALMAMQAACKGAADRARKDERERHQMAMQQTIRLGEDYASDIRGDWSDFDGRTLMRHDMPRILAPIKAILRDDEPDDRDACDRGDP